MTPANPNMAGAPQTRVEGQPPLDPQNVDPRRAGQNGAAQHGTDNHQTDGAQAGQNLVTEWPYGEDDDDQQAPQGAPQTVQQGPGFRTRLGNSLMPVRHHAGAARAAVFGEAGNRYQRHLEAGRAERDAARRETLGRWAAQGLVARWQGFNNRREALAAGIRDIRQRLAAHRIENALNREHRRGNTHINWDALQGARVAESTPLTSEGQRDDRQPSSIRGVPRNPRSPLTSADDRAAGSGARRNRRGAPDQQQDDGSQAGDLQPQVEQRSVFNDPAMAIAAREFQNLTPAEQDAIKAGEGVKQYIANRAALLPNLVWGKLAIARMGQLMSGVPETQYDAAAWDELLAKPWLLPAGTRPESWVLHRSIILANQPRTAEEAQAESERINTTRIALRAEKRIRDEAERAEEARKAEVAARAKQIASILRPQLASENIIFDPRVQGNRIVRASDRAEWVLQQAIAIRERNNLPNPFNDPRRSQSENARNLLHAVRAIAYAIVETGLQNSTANRTKAEAAINADALLRAVQQEVLGY